MRARELKQLLSLTAKLTPSQREQVMAHLSTGLALDQATSIVQGRMAQQPCCPKCLAQHVVRNGQAGGLQRYKCRSCGVTFNALSGTPLARLRDRDKWLERAQAMDEGLSVRKAAACIGVHRTTAFRWRHRFLALPRDVKANKLAGVAEADETYVLRSYRGQRRKLVAEQTRKPCHRGGKASVACLPSRCRYLCCATAPIRPRTKCCKPPTSDGSPKRCNWPWPTTWSCARTAAACWPR